MRGHFGDAVGGGEILHSGVSQRLKGVKPGVHQLLDLEFRDAEDVETGDKACQGNRSYSGQVAQRFSGARFAHALKLGKLLPLEGVEVRDLADQAGVEELSQENIPEIADVQDRYPFLQAMKVTFGAREVRAVQAFALVDQVCAAHLAGPRHRDLSGLRQMPHQALDLRDDVAALAHDHLAADAQAHVRNQFRMDQAGSANGCAGELDRIDVRHGGVQVSGDAPLNLAQNAERLLRRELECDLLLGAGALHVGPVDFRSLYHQTVDIELQLRAALGNHIAVVYDLLGALKHLVRHGVKPLVREPGQLGQLVVKWPCIAIHVGVVAHHGEVFAALTVLALHESVGGVAAVGFVGVVATVDLVRHDHLAAHGAGEPIRKPRNHALHASHVCRNVVSDDTVATGDAPFEETVAVLQLETGTVEFVLHDIAPVGNAGGPFQQLVRATRLLLAAHGHEVTNLGKP